VVTTKSGGNDGNVNIKNNLTGQLSGGYANVGAGDLVVSGYGTNEQQPAVVTLVNLDGSISANQDLGVIQFGGKDDSSVAYCNAQIIGTAKQAAGTGSSGGGHLRFLTATASAGASPIERMRITSLGNVGVGTTSPDSALEVVDQVPYGGILITGDNAPGLTIKDNSSTSESKIYVQSVASPGSSGNLRISADNNNTGLNPTIELRVGNSEKMRITDNGNVGIGTTKDPQQRVAKLY
jgi:hypothetical protein